MLKCSKSQKDKVQVIGDKVTVIIDKLTVMMGGKVTVIFVSQN